MTERSIEAGHCMSRMATALPFFPALLLLPILILAACRGNRIADGCGPAPTDPVFTGADGEVRLMTLDPGHFHAALVQKSMYDRVAPDVHVYAPDGPDVKGHLKRIEGFNTRQEDPTHWKEKTFLGKGFLEKMLRDRPGNVVVISGNNRKKAEQIKACIDAGLNVLADKPMCIDASGRVAVEAAFAAAAEKGVLLYDMMTERSEITTILQKELSHDKKVFGTLLPGTVDDPSVIKESVHHFFKYVAGSAIRRPAWFFDTTQQGEGIVDVTNHLIDLVMWECFPEEALDFEKDIVIRSARRWPTLITPGQFRKVTGRDAFPACLKEQVNGDGNLPCFANGEIGFTLRGIHAKTAVRWNYQAPEGAKDTHFSIMRGTKASIVILQGKEEGYRAELYVEPAAGLDPAAFAGDLRLAVEGLQADYPGVAVERENNRWHVLIPDRYRIGHEAHFGQVTERYLKYLGDGKLPAWEVPNMITRLRITTDALERALPEEGETMLFDGSGFEHWTGLEGKPAGWSIADGAMVVKPGSGSIMTREAYDSFRLHVEFRVPVLPAPAENSDRGNRGNSGVYLQRRYEVQILDSFGVKPETWDCGALYRAKAPDRNASRKAGTWQSYDITFHSARFEGEGEALRKTSNTRITVVHNGVTIHNDVELGNRTGRGLREGPGAGPILLQDHGNAVRFRNIRIERLDS
jgi:predicted dehydrogenase